MSKKAAAKKPKQNGPPPFKPNWDEVAKLCSIHCTQKEIADFFDVTVDTLENACLRDRKERLSVFWDKNRGLQRVRLKKIQWSLAEQGSATMAIFLGKHLLGQSNEPSDTIIQAVQRSGLTREEVITLIEQASATAAKTGKRSFEEFVIKAGYPAPFAKQIEMMRFGIDEEEPRLLLGARGYGKTDYVVILGLAYEIYVKPHESTNFIVTKSRERNGAMLGEIQKAAEANGVTFESANTNFLRVPGLVGKDHSVSAATIKTASFRGRHPRRIILDDPVTEDDTSEATRALVKKKWNEILKLCKNVLVIGQPAHKFDLYADLRPLLKKLEVPHGSIPELDHDLEAQRLAGVDEASIQASYFLNVLSEGTTPFDKIRYIDAFPIGESAVAFIDPSHEGGDYTAISIVRKHFDGIAVVGFVWKKAWNHCLDEMVAKLNLYKVRKLAFETNALGDQPIIMLRQLFGGGGVVGRRSNTNKHSRIMGAGSYAHLIHLSKESDAKYISQVVQYEYKAKNDDAPDSLATCLEWIGLIRGKE